MEGPISELLQSKHLYVYVRGLPWKLKSPTAIANVSHETFLYPFIQIPQRQLDYSPVRWGRGLTVPGCWWTLWRCAARSRGRSPDTPSCWRSLLLQKYRGPDLEDGEQDIVSSLSRTQSTWKHSHGKAFVIITTFSSSSPSSSVFSFVQLVLSFTFLKCGCFSLRPVSNTATFTPEPVHAGKSYKFSLITPECLRQMFAPPPSLRPGPLPIWEVKKGAASDPCVPSARGRPPAGSGPRGGGWPAAGAGWTGAPWRARSPCPATGWFVGRGGTTARSGWRCRGRRARVLRGTKKTHERPRLKRIEPRRSLPVHVVSRQSSHGHFSF